MPGIVKPLPSTQANPHVVVKALGSKQKRTYSIGDKNKEIKKQGTKFIPK
jgi:hypothetical protein